MTLFPSGVLLFLLGLLGDFQGWWENFAFMTNAFSSLAGVAVGIPFALFVLDQLASDRAELTEKRAASRLAAVAAESFSEYVSFAVRPEHQDTALDRLQQLKGILQTAHQVLTVQRQQFGAELHQLTDGSDVFFTLSLESDSVPREVLQQLEERYQANAPDWAPILNPIVLQLGKCDSELTSTVRWSVDHRRWREHLEFEWRSLERDDRPRLLVAGLSWLPANRSVAVRQALRRIDKTAFLEELNRWDWDDGAVWEEYLLHPGEIHRTLGALRDLVAQALNWTDDVIMVLENAQFAATFFGQQAPDAP